MNTEDLVGVWVGDERFEFLFWTVQRHIAYLDYE
jgi:hypothetical protein